MSFRNFIPRADPLRTERRPLRRPLPRRAVLPARTLRPPARTRRLSRPPRAPRSLGNRLEDQLVRTGVNAAIQTIPVVGAFAPILTPLVAPLVEGAIDAVGSDLADAFTGAGPHYTEAEILANAIAVGAGDRGRTDRINPALRTLED